MKNFILLLCLMLATTIHLGAQPIDCMTGPGAGGSYTSCDQDPVTYNVSSCPCGDFWWFSINGSIDIFPFTNLPHTFSIGNFGGTIVAANVNGITINWDCSDLDCCSGKVLTTLEYCGTEFFNPTIRLTCTPDPEACGGGPVVGYCKILLFLWN